MNETKLKRHLEELANCCEAMLECIQGISAALAPAPAPVTNKQLRVTMARSMGYTGDTCKQCYGVHMVRRGTCLYCDDCQASEGCS